MLVVVLVIIFILALYRANQNYSPECSIYNKGYGSGRDNVNILLDRIQYANHYKGRLNIYSRHIVYAFLIVVVLSQIWPSISILQFIQAVFVTFLLIQSFYVYTQHHSEKFPHYSIDRNIRLIKKKLRLKGACKLSPSKRIFSSASSCWNFTYRRDE